MITLHILLLTFRRHLKNRITSGCKDGQNKLPVNEPLYDFIIIHNRHSAFSTPDLFQVKKAYCHHLPRWFLFSCELLCVESLYLAFFKIRVTDHHFFHAFQLFVLPHWPLAILVYPECFDRRSPSEKKGSVSLVAHGCLFTGKFAVLIPPKFS